MSTLIIFNKPFHVLSQFRRDGERETLANFIDIPNVYPAGRLDYDSEGLLLLTGDGPLQHSISHPDRKLKKTYWVQVEGEIDDTALERLSSGLELKDGPTRPALAQRMIEPPNLWPRNPPVRYRAAIPTSWLSLTILEGRNRQVRRMTAAVGFPTLRLVRHAIGDWNVEGLAPGQYRRLQLSPEQYQQLCPRPAGQGRLNNRARSAAPRKHAERPRSRGRNSLKPLK